VKNLAEGGPLVTIGGPLANVQKKKKGYWIRMWWMSILQGSQAFSKIIFHTSSIPFQYEI